MSKVYVVGAKHTDIEKIRLMVNVPESTEIILVDSMELVPFEARIQSDLSVREIIQFTAIPRCDIPDRYYAKQGHKRPYKFHR